MWQNAFKPDLAKNLRRVSDGYTKQLLMLDIAKECIMYSCDMCLEYYRQGAYAGISTTTIDNISYNVCIAMGSLVKEFSSCQYDEVMSRVRQLMANPRTYDVLQEEVNRYYGN